MDISMDIHGKSVDMDIDMDGKFHIHGKPGFRERLASITAVNGGHVEQWNTITNTPTAMIHDIRFRNSPFTWYT